MTAATTSASQSRPIVVIGAGIIGLTTTVRLLESPAIQECKIPVHVLADHLPHDPLDARYASTIAGAHHLSFADDDDARQTRWDKRTFTVMYDEWRAEGEKTGLMLLKQTEYYVGTDKHLMIYESHPDFLVNAMSDLKLGFPADHSIAFTSLTMTPLVYLDRLLKRIAQLGGFVHRYHFPSLSHLGHPSITALIGREPPSHVVACVGLGAATLGGVEDPDVYPTRGQVVKVRAPWVRSGSTRQVGSLDGGEGGERTYVIPRPDGEVILGGTREEHDWNPYPREDTGKDILRRALEICPALQPAHRLAPALGTNSGPTPPPSGGAGPLDDLVVSHLVGFRPSRTGGVRLELGPDVAVGHGATTKVVYNYGHGGAGWQSCWGTAEDALALVLQSM